MGIRSLDERPRWSWAVAILELAAVLALLPLPMCSAQLPSGRSCFCKLNEAVDECACSVDSVDQFNNNIFFPLLQALLQKDFFRYYKVNMDRQCPFWPDDRECVSRECGIENCDDQVPDALKRPLTSFPKKSNPAGQRQASAQAGEESSCNGDDSSNKFDPLDLTLTKAAEKQFADWALFDDAENKFCDVDDEQSEEMHYVDLARNPERYTGYKGNSAQRVWKAIYMENCFKPSPKFDKNFLLYLSISGLCLEKRVFFRLMSGLHTSITISIAAHNYQPAPGGIGEGRWVRNIDMFKARFSPELTWNEGPQRLKNLYFIFLFELRALQKAAPYLTNELFYTGNEAVDGDTRLAIQNLMNVIAQWPHHFDETSMFQGSEAKARELKEEFRLHFTNVSRIMDCVGCDKCRLWGKLQAHGIGAALKILFADIPKGIHRRLTAGTVPFQLTRNEVVALFQSIGRFASSIREVGEFRSILDI